MSVLGYAPSNAGTSGATTSRIFAATDTNKFVVSLGDLGESKDCTGSGSLFAGTTECFKLARALGFGLRRAPQG